VSPESELLETARRIVREAQRPPLEVAAFTVPQFCLAHQMSRSALYELWRNGIGPTFYRAGKSIRISRESAADWRREREQATSQGVA
jgi:hypothetical protein